MKYLVAISIFLVFVLFIKRNECKYTSSVDVDQGTNNVQVDYTQQKQGTRDISSGDGLRSTWIWEPEENQKNKIKFEPLIVFFESAKESGLDGDATETRHDVKDVQHSNQHGEWTFIEVNNTKKKTESERKQSIFEKTHFMAEKHLRKTNWCFKGATDYNYHKFEKTAECCTKRKQCRRLKHVEKGLSQCSCDINFYRCLMKAGTAMSNSVGRLYFNSHKVVCFRKVIVRPCKKLPCKLQYKQKIITRNFPL